MDTIRLSLLLTSLLAGVLTILAPCVLPLLPVIVGGAASSQNKWQPVIMTGSLIVSIIAFTFLLKVSTSLLNIHPRVWTSISGGILGLFGIFMLFPGLWEWLSVKLNFLSRSQANLAKASATRSGWSGVLIGAALGPVFSSCSPTYFIILATVLPASLFAGTIYLIAYGLGLGVMLGLIAFFGQRLTLKLGWAANSHGWFKRAIGVLLILVGVGILTGIDKRIEVALLERGFGITKLEEQLVLDIQLDMEEEAEAEDRADEAEFKSITEQEEVEESVEIPLGELNRMPFPAPELAGLENWINSEPIESMDELKGKVVLIDFWTYSCINCIRTLPYLQSWHEKYANDGFVLIGVHAPEFSFERVPENVREAVKDFGLTYPVVQDNEKTLWRAYENRFWPAKYLIDKEGTVRYARFGEGDYEDTEAQIVKLLNAETKEVEINAQEVDFTQIGTRETYIGLRRRENFVEADQQLGKNEWTLTGLWEADDEKAISLSEGSIKMNFTANKANLVMSGSGQVEVWIDGELANTSNAGADVSNEGILTFDAGKARLYELADFNMNYEEHDIELKFSEPGVELFAWTFG